LATQSQGFLSWSSLKYLGDDDGFPPEFILSKAKDLETEGTGRTEEIGLA
jgi:hypothetical protein